MGSSGWESELDAIGGDHEGDQEKKPETPEEALFTNGELPADIKAVWGNDPNAALFIREWGLEAFRGSKLHQMALLEQARDKRLAPVRAAYTKKGGAKK